MINNPYNGILNILKQQNYNSSSAVVMGKVNSTTPLSISIGELFLDREDLMVNKSIESFKEGDMLAMVPATNKQKYIILCKMVSIFPFISEQVESKNNDIYSQMTPYTLHLQQKQYLER